VPRVVCDGRAIELREGARLMDGLEQAGVAIASSCRAGACQSCLVKATRGTPPAAAQVGLKDTLRAQGFFLACVAEPREDLEITLGAVSALSVPARVARVERIADATLRVTVEPSAPFPHRAGQFLTLVRDDGLARAYSIASAPETDSSSIELHVRVHPGGQMSGWLASRGALGANVHLRGPAGECFYTSGDAAQKIVLAGTGTGLAPLLGVLRDALRAGHQGPIQLWHGARTPPGLYLVDELRALAARRPQLSYRRVVLEGAPKDGVSVGRLDDALLADGSLAGSRVFLCGDPDLVRSLKRRVFLAGAALKDIHADPFVTATPAAAR
jgi:ferredoxin-NADP reductase/ferredoxin